MKRGHLVIATALLAAGCSGEVSGVVRDASTGEPLGGARVALQDSGWGFRNGGLVWDKLHTYETVSEADGTFSIGRRGGINLVVETPDGRGVKTSLCPRSPMVLRIGGPYPSLEADETLHFPVPGRPAGRDGQGAWASDYGLTITDTPSADESELIVESPLGVRFVPGRGAIPAAPPLPYPKRAVLGAIRDCGWLFISDGSHAVAVVQTGTLFRVQSPDGSQRYSLLYTPLP